jgi:hypothetical protein
MRPAVNLTDDQGSGDGAKYRPRHGLQLVHVAVHEGHHIRKHHCSTPVLRRC